MDLKIENVISNSGRSRFLTFGTTDSMFTCLVINKIFNPFRERVPDEGPD
jgi:hypothetical protein